MKRTLHFFNADAGGGSGGAAVAAAPAAGGATIISGAAAGGDGDAGANGGNGSAAASGFSWAKEDGTLDPGWLDRLPSDLKGNDSLKPITSIHDLAKNYVFTKSMVGKKLEAPAADAAPEQITAWRKTVGAPETAEGYYPDGSKSLRPEVVPEGMWDASSEKKFLEIAHKHHLPHAAVKDILAYYGDSLAEGLKGNEQKFKEHQESERAVLRKEWGDKFDENNKDAARMMTTLGLPTDRLPTISEYGKAMARGVHLFSEDRVVKGETIGFNGSIALQISDIQDPKGTSMLSREYRGEFGPERQQAAQGQLHQLLAAKAAS